VGAAETHRIEGWDLLVLVPAFRAASALAAASGSPDEHAGR
jgi:hypothetical protein